MNPLNQLPIDPAMVRRVDELAAQCAEETGHTVFLIVLKDNGKCHITVEGVPESGQVAEMMADIPRFLEFTAHFIRLSDELDKREPKS